VDEEIALLMGKILMARGIGIRTGAAVRRIEEAGEGRRVLWEEAGKGECLEAEAVLAAVGRVPNTEGLAEVGLRVEGGRILTDERQRTSLPGVYAVGDAAGGRLAHGAMAEGRAAAQRAVQTAPADCFAETRADEGSIPFCVYTRPEIAGVGITLGEARKQGVDPLVGKFPLAGNARALTLGEPRGFVKVLADRRDHRILGVHLFGPGVTELAGEAALALRLGAALEDLRGVIHPHPTVSEALGEAAWDATGECGYKFARRPVC
jgi:dihydrolipoamide dehydrogenase